MKQLRFEGSIGRRSRFIIVRGVGICMALFLIASPTFAQNDDEDHHFTFSVGGGLTTITGRDAGKLDHGGNLQAGAGYFFNRYVGVTGNFMFSQLGITGRELNILNEPDGNARTYTFTVDPTIRVLLRGGVSVYALAGGGFLRRTVEFTQPTLAQTFIYDPWWGFFGPALIPANQILGSVTSDSGAINTGAGVNFPLPGTRLHLFVEARYVHGFTGNTNTSIVPIVFGIRM